MSPFSDLYTVAPLDVRAQLVGLLHELAQYALRGAVGVLFLSFVLGLALYVVGPDVGRAERRPKTDARKGAS